MSLRFLYSLENMFDDLWAWGSVEYKVWVDILIDRVLKTVLSICDWWVVIEWCEGHKVLLILNRLVELGSLWLVRRKGRKVRC